ncbi:MAG TPA: phosphatidylserine decarboxylase family protein [Bacteroidia bacterium]|nr:phosphatidylserine decarboxylase family protein [Bacteroidia bacterium]
MFRFHREGIKMINTLLVLLGAVNLGMLIFLKGNIVLLVGVAIVSVVVFILIAQFFRNPRRSVPRNDKYIICPADGKVVVIEKTFEPEFLKCECYQVSVFMSPLNVHVNRYPVSGKIAFLRYHQGKKLVAWHPKSSTENERTTIVIEKDNKIQILVRQIAGALANRIVYYPHEGDLVRAGAELGFIKFGSRVDLFLPLDCQLMIHLNQKVVGGETVIAELP